MLKTQIKDLEYVIEKVQKFSDIACIVRVNDLKHKRSGDGGKEKVGGNTGTFR